MLTMIQYTSNYGSWTPKLLIQAINLGIKLFLLQKESTNEGFGYMLMISVAFMMGKICLSRNPESCVLHNHYHSVQGCQRSYFKSVSLKIIPGHLR